MARAKFQAVRSTGTLEPVSYHSEDAPDASITFEALRWRSNVFGGVMVDTSSIDRRFVWSRLETLRAGVRGRGKVDLTDEGILTVQFGLTDGEITQGFLEQYVHHLLQYMSLTPAAVVETRIATVDRDPAVDEEIEAGLRKLGLRAILG